jgi:uncharacterized protein (TIGR03086 family)
VYNQRMDKTLEWYGRALEEFGKRVHLVKPDQWGCPTPCSDWQVRQLVNHLVVEQLWVPPLVAGQTIADVGNRFDGDQLGDDPVQAWDDASAAAYAAFAEDGAMDRAVHLSYADRPGREYCMEMLFDAVVHSWDLARAIGVDEKLDPELVEQVYAKAETDAEVLAASGLFAAPVPVAENADRQTRLIGITGRQP